MGSPLYMSPEALKKNIYSIKNDIWSIGIMVYELLHGETPWDCRTETELVDKMTKIPVKFKESLNLSKEMKEFIRKCLEVDQQKRMSLPDLREWSNHHPSMRNASEKVLQRKVSVPEIAITRKPASDMEKKPLGDATNRLSLPSEKHRSLSSIVPKQFSEAISNNNK